MIGITKFKEQMRKRFGKSAGVGLFWKVLLLCLLVTFSEVGAQTPTEANQRYWALLLLNLSEERDFELEVIRRSASAGMNSVVITVFWDKVYRNSPTGPGDWAKFDNQVQLATSLGMKVAFRIFVGRNTAYLNGFWTDAESTRDYKQNPLRETYDYTSFSFLHQPSVNKAADFVKQVTERYKYLQQTSKILFISVVTTPTQETGYHPINIPINGGFRDAYLTIFDYSDFYKKGFIEWVRGKYKKLIRLNLLWGADYKSFDDILPSVAPWDTKESFFGRRGKDWYIYRHLILKQFNDQMIDVVKGVDKSIPFIPEFGAVIDDMSGIRGTLAFQDLCSKADGVKIHDSEQYDHRWTMDVIRSNSRPDQWVMNEVFYADYLAKSEYYEQIDECFASGAKLVCFVLSTPGHVDAVQDVIRNSANKWVNMPMEPILPKDTVSYALSRVVDRGIYNVGTFNEWKTIARGGASPKPVFVKLNEDLLKDDYWAAAANSLPYLLNPIPMQTIAITRNFTYRIPSDTFADYDGVITKIEIPTLPAWLRYQDGQLIGVPTALGDTRLLVRGVDDEGGITEAYLTIRVDTRENANKPPTVKKNLANVTITFNEPFSFILPKDLFVDEDGGVTRIEASELPAWLVFQNGELRGFPTKSGDYRIALKAYDEFNAFVEIYFTIQVVEPQYLNNAPYVQGTIPVQFAKVNEPFTFELSPSLFVDSDGYITLVSAQNLPRWLSFTLNKFSGIPTEEGEFRIVVRAYDNAGGFVETPLVIKVEVPKLTFDLLRSGRAIDRQLLRPLANGDVLFATDLPPLLNIYAYGNFDFDQVSFTMNGPYRYSAAVEKFPYALFQDESGFAPYVGGYTLQAQAFKKDSLVLTTTLRFRITPGDSAQPNRQLDAWQSYPNPFESVFNIQLPDEDVASSFSFSLITASGKRMTIDPKWVTLENRIAQIDLTGLSLAAGLYFIQVESKGENLHLFRVLKR